MHLVSFELLNVVSEFNYTNVAIPSWCIFSVASCSVVISSVFLARIPIASTRSRGEHPARGANPLQRCSEVDRTHNYHQTTNADTASPVLARSIPVKANDGRRTREPSSRTDRRRYAVTSSRVWQPLPIGNCVCYAKPCRFASVLCLIGFQCTVQSLLS